jgi:hypothetical protein
MVDETAKTTTLGFEPVIDPWLRCQTIDFACG